MYYVLYACHLFSKLPCSFADWVGCFSTTGPQNNNSTKVHMHVQADRDMIANT